MSFAAYTAVEVWKMKFYFKYENNTVSAFCLLWFNLLFRILIDMPESTE